MNIEELFAKNEDDVKGTAPVLTPRSAQAVLLCGIAPSDLAFRTYESFHELKLDPKIQKLRYDFYESQRIQVMAEARRAKEEVIKSEQERLMLNIKLSPIDAEAHQLTAEQYLEKNKSRSRSRSPSLEILESLNKAELNYFGIGDTTLHGSMKKSKSQDSRRSSQQQQFDEDALGTLVKLEKQRLEKIRIKQKKEIEQLLAFEMRQNELKAEADERLKRDALKKEKLERQRQQRVKEQAIKRREKELQKLCILKEEEKERRLFQQAEFKKSKELARQEEIKKERLLKEAARKQKEREDKMKELRASTQAIISQQENELLIRLQKRKLKDQVRQKALAVAQEELKKLSDAKLERTKKRLEQNQLALEKKEEARLQSFQEKVDRAMQRKQEQDKALEKELEEKRIRVELAESKRLMAIKEAQNIVLMKTCKIRKEQDEERLRLQSKMQIREEDLMMKREQRRLQTQQKLINIERMRKRKEYKKLMLSKKIEADFSKIGQMISQKDLLLQKRIKAGIDAKRRREELSRAMEDIRRTKAWNKAEDLLDKVIGDDNMPATSPKSKQGFDVRGVLLDKEDQVKATQAIKDRVDSGNFPTIGVAAVIANAEKKLTNKLGSTNSKQVTPIISPYAQSKTNIAQTKKQVHGKAKI